MRKEREELKAELAETKAQLADQTKEVERTARLLAQMREEVETIKGKLVNQNTQFLTGRCPAITVEIFNSKTHKCLASAIFLASPTVVCREDGK